MKRTWLAFSKHNSDKVLIDFGLKWHRQMSTAAQASHATVYIALGSNIGDRANNLHQALRALEKAIAPVEATSGLYESKAQYVVDQPDFLNAVCRLRSCLRPSDVLRLLKRVEKEMGRIPSTRFGPRIIDLDILLYGPEHIVDKRADASGPEDEYGTLNIPHPRLHEREFVLRPLHELGSDLLHPTLNQPIHHLLSKHLASLPHGPSTRRVLALPRQRFLGLDSLVPPTAIMGILNATPDSFSDGGEQGTSKMLEPGPVMMVANCACIPTGTGSLSLSNLSHEVYRAYSPLPPKVFFYSPLVEPSLLMMAAARPCLNIGIQHGLTMMAEGCHVIDIGGESTRPGAAEVSAEVELDRILPVIRGLRSMSDAIPISVDTRKADVAEGAIQAGADVINDVSGGIYDPRMFATAARLQVPLILMHMRGTPPTMMDLANYGEEGVVKGVMRELRERLLQAERAGVVRWSLVADPGIGFAKNREHNLALLRDMSVFVKSMQGVPVLVGASRKRFIGKICGQVRAADRDIGTVAAHSAAVLHGASMVRVHNVACAVQSMKVIDAIRSSWQREE